MATFKVQGTIAPAATKTPLVITGSATLRPRLTEVAIATAGVPSSEASIQVALRASTAAGTSTAVTPRPNNSLSVAGFTAGSNCSAEPTYGAVNLGMFQGNPRNRLAWQALTADAEVVAAAASANGVGAQILIPGGALTSVDADFTVTE